MTKKFVLIDGNAIMHRAYHALPPFTTSKGKPVGAVYGFVAMLLKVLSDLKPTHLAVAFDMAAPTFRNTLYVGYHANRPQMESDLSAQFESVRKVLDAMNISQFGVEGYEGDDVIGTLARQAFQKTQNQVGLGQNTRRNRKSEKPVVQKIRQSESADPLGVRSSEFSESSGNFEVIIVTGDRDMLQLVNSHVKVYMPIKGLSEAKLFGSQEVKEKYGLEPEQVIDMKALTGDASDNYPGVAGIGPKTASALLQKYETLENVYQHLSELSERQAKTLATGAESAGLAKKLATIVTDVPLQFSLNSCVFSIKNSQKAIAVLREYEFRTLPNRLLELLGKEPLKKEASTLQKKEKSDQLRLV